MRIAAFAVAGMLAVSSSPASSAFVSGPVPSSAFITVRGLDWAWASPLSWLTQVGIPDPLPDGWRLPTVGELANAPLATDFIFPGANVPLGGADPVSGASFWYANSNLTGAAACAASYFSADYTHCDWVNGLGQPQGPWAGMPGSEFYSDWLVVRDVAVPLPATLSLIGAALALLWGLGRRRRGAVVTA